MASIDTVCKAVDELQKEQRLYSKVIDNLKIDETLETPVRKKTLQIANACLWEDEGKEEEKTEE